MLMGLSLSVFAQKTVSGVKLANSVTKEGKSLQLNGAGVRTKFFIDLYVGSLYLSKKNSSSSQVINADEHSMVRLDIVSSLITKEKMRDAVKDGFKNSTNGNTKALQARIDRFIKIFERPINVGDVLELVYVPGTGTKVYGNGELLDTIQGLDFKQALWGIWIGDKPAQDSLKNEMLGK